LQLINHVQSLIAPITIANHKQRIIYSSVSQRYNLPFFLTHQPFTDIMTTTSSALQENTSGKPPLLTVAIAGGGISGLITAIALLKHPGVSVQIYERAKEFREIGASIGLGPNGLRSLEKLGVENALSGDVCQRQRSDWPMIFRHWKTGEVIDHDVHYTVKDKRHATARYHRAHLHQALLENLPRGIVHLGKKTVEVKADLERGVTLVFEDGSTAEADICIGADGIHSVGLASCYV
jgi:salicylate hydroxylase